MKHWHVLFRGRVQGVGFRWTVQKVGKESGITGWVRNLADGRVEMKAQGSIEALEELLRRLDKRFHIEQQEISEEELASYLSFEIRR